MNGRELYELIQGNFNHLSGNWTVEANDDLKITGYTQPTGLVFDQTLGKITELTVEWDTTCLSAGGYIHGNLSPVFYYDTDFDWAHEGHDGKTQILVHNCDYTGNGNGVGTLMQLPVGAPTGTSIWSNVVNPIATGSITPNTRHTFKFDKRDGYIRFYEDDVLLSEMVDDYANIPLYFGWYFWFGSSNSSYSANFIIHSYSMSGRDTTAVTPSTSTTDIEFVGRTALARIASIIKNYVDNHTHSSSALDTAFSDIQGTLEQLQDGLDTQSNTIDQHIQDSVSHITAEERDTWNNMANGGGSSGGDYVALPENDDDEFTVGSVVLCQMDVNDFPTYIDSSQRRISHGDQISGTKLETAQFWVDSLDDYRPEAGRSLSGEWIYLGATYDGWTTGTAKYFYGIFRRKS